MRVVNAGPSRRSLAVELDCSLVYDFLLGPMVAQPVAGEYDEFEATLSRQATVAARGGAPILDALERQVGTARLLHHELLSLAPLAVGRGVGVPAFLDLVEQTPAEQVAELLLEDRCGMDETEADPPIAAALTGDRAAVMALLERRQGEERRRAAQWLADPEGTRADLLTLLRQWHAVVFAADEARLTAVLARDMAAKERVRASEGIDGLLRAIGGTLQLVFGPGARRIVLAPAVDGRPVIFLLERPSHGLHLVIYPVADDSLEAPEPLAPPRALLRLHKALADETRLKMLRLVAQDELYATEIAERLGLAKATVSHHLVLLRAAGLVSVTGERKAERYIALNPPALDEGAAHLKRFLGI
jgi:DNA-binding transcriptional ArsR family regulator